MLLRLKIIFVVSCLWTALSCAADNYDANPSAQVVIDELVVEEGFDREQLMMIFAQAERKDSILKAIARPAEKTKAWYEYRAIIGVETSYGRVAGSYRVIDALSTLAFDYPPRSPFFTSELKNVLILSRDQGIDPMSLMGSYAGAMGYGQFMPSSYRNYAIDFDNDDIVDIWNNPVDAIGSVANYFKQHGWRTGDIVVSAATAAKNTPKAIFVKNRKDLQPTRTVAQFAAEGVVATIKLDPEALATAMKFEQKEGYEYWLGLHNFYVITRYNHSAMYAMCVYQLSQALAARVAR